MIEPVPVHCFSVAFLLLFKTTSAPVMKRLKANGASLMSDFYRTFLKMAWLRLCQITNESTETEICN